MSTVSEFARLLRQFRLEAGWTQEQLAQRCTVSVRTISDLERGRIARPRGYTAEQLAGGLPLSCEQRDQLLIAARQPVDHVTPDPPDFDVPAADGPFQPGQLAGAIADIIDLVAAVDKGVAVVLVVLIAAA